VKRFDEYPTLLVDRALNLYQVVGVVEAKIDLIHEHAVAGSDIAFDEAASLEDLIHRGVPPGRAVVFGDVFRVCRCPSHRVTASGKAVLVADLPRTIPAPIADP
jgi:hypothetical protein